MLMMLAALLIALLVLGAGAYTTAWLVARTQRETAAAPQPPALAQATLDLVRELCAQGEELEAVRQVRQDTGLPLHAAAEVVEEVQRDPDSVPVLPDSPEDQP